MNIENIGDIIYTLRTYQKISKDELCKGLCLRTTLVEIENGIQKPDKFLFEALLQRLGKSPDKIETILSLEDYMLYSIRIEMEDALIKQDYYKVLAEAKKYESRIKKSLKLHEQYLCKTYAILELEQKHDMGKGIAYLEEAIKMTFPEFDLENIRYYILGSDEVILLLMLAEQYAKKDKERAKQLLIELLKYVDNRFTDEEEAVKLLPKVSYVLATLLLEQKEYDEVIVISKRAVNFLVDNGVAIGLLKNMDIYLEALKKVNRMEEYTYLKYQRDALNDVIEEYGYSDYYKNMPVWIMNTQKDIFLMHELLIKTRKKLKMSQEKLANIIEMGQNTISRLERGSSAPSPNTFEKLKSVFEIDRNYYNSFINADDFRAYEMRREISKKLYLHQFKEAELTFDKLKLMLTKNSTTNLQYIKYMETLFDQKNNKISNEEAIKGYWEALRYTQKDLKTQDLSSGILTRDEIFIVNNIIMALYYDNRKLECIELGESVLKGLENSKVDTRYHFVSERLIISNLTTIYEETDQFDKALEYCDRCIKLELQNGRCNTLPKLLTAINFTHERMSFEKNVNDYKEIYKQAYWLFVLLKDNVKKKNLMLYYEDRFGESLP